jgi:thiamine-phosphate pyrophosphorylase
MAEAGLQLIQVRHKEASAATLLRVARELLQALSAYDVRLIVNDRPDVAAIAGAAGVHVGQTDLPVEDARKICPTPRWVGVSTHNIEQFREAAATSADYIAVGPIFPTATKANPDPVVGVDFLRTVRPLTSKPLVAIGGITLDSAAEVFRAGADSVAVIRDLLSAEHPGLRVQGYLKIAQRERAKRH